VLKNSILLKEISNASDEVIVDSEFTFLLSTNTDDDSEDLETMVFPKTIELLFALINGFGDELSLTVSSPPQPIKKQKKTVKIVKKV
tara:strand:+ start:640 stop:900 length:261 start_codon:yes stop_codon:yes gene_type:complete